MIAGGQEANFLPDIRQLILVAQRDDLKGYRQSRRLTPSILITLQNAWALPLLRRSVPAHAIIEVPRSPGQAPPRSRGGEVSIFQRNCSGKTGYRVQDGVVVHTLIATICPVLRSKAL